MIFGSCIIEGWIEYCELAVGIVAILKREMRGGAARLRSDFWTSY
jgi:hypothetical protein